MESFKLWESNPPYYNPEFGQPEPTIDFYPGEKGRGCVVVCPGGGYEGRAFHEGEPVAQMFNRSGINAFVLNYRVKPYDYRAFRADVTRAMRFAKFHANDLEYDFNHIAVLGFSAGGHLAMTAIENFDTGLDTGDEIDRTTSRPDAGILCYPVITLGDYTHEGSRKFFLGKDINDIEREKLINQYSGEKSVRDDMPPVFFWHTADDGGVDPLNTLNMAEAMIERKLPLEVHIFPFGNHGLGLAEGIPSAGQWPSLCVNWLNDLKF